MIFQRVQVQRVDFFVLAYAFVESLAGFLAKPAALHHLLHEGRGEEAVAPGVGGDAFIKIHADEAHDVQADDVEQAERGAVRKADERAR